MARPKNIPPWNPKKWTITPTGAKKITDEQAWEIITTRYQTTHREMAEKHGISVWSVLAMRKGDRRKPLHRELAEIESLI